MPSTIDMIAFVGYAFLLLTTRSSLVSAWRRRDARELNVLVVVGTLAASPLLRGTPGQPSWDLHIALLMFQPFLTIRLVEEFRDVPLWIERGAIGVAIAGTAALVGWPGERPDGVDFAVGIGVAALQAYVAGAFTREAGRSSGVTAKRLTFAAIGSWAFVGVFVLLGLTEFAPHWRWATATPVMVLTSIVFCAYYFAFSTPGWLKASWRNKETSRYLIGQANRDAEKRGEEAADDLKAAVSASVANAVTLVALPSAVGSKDLMVWSSTDASLVGITVIPATGLIGHAFRSGAIASTPTACEPAIAERLRPHGTRVLVAPVATEQHTWGVVLVVQRRGSLFPEDDLQLVAQLARYAATALDHASLVIDAREHERYEADRKVRETESRMGVLLGSIKDYALYVLDTEGTVVTWHSGAEHVFGNAGIEMRGGSAGALFDLSDADFQARLQDAREQEHVEFECPCFRGDGTRFTGITVLRPLDEKVSDLAGFAAVTHDVTERRDLESRLLQSQKLDAIGQLAGGVAHDVNNRLQSIVGNVDLIMTSPDMAGRFREEFDDIQNEAAAASALTGQLLAFGQRQMLHPAALDLNAIVSGHASLLQRTLGAQVTITTDLAPELEPILGAQGQIETMVLNLALNARDAMPDGGRLRIRTANLRLEADDGDLAAGSYAVLEVSDTGVGMDPATISRLFEPFFTTKGLGRGTGLGLATLYGAVRQMGGAVRVDSAVGQGTTFRIFFPAAQARAAEALRPAEPSAAGAADGVILVVEDNPAVRALLSRMLTKAGYSVIAADRPATALDEAKAHAAELRLVITDVVMPGQLGPAFVESLAAVRPGLPVLYISGYSDAVVAWRGALPDAGHFLQKPFTMDELLGRVRRILQP